MKTTTKDPKNVERGKKAYETHLKKIKEGILSSTTSSGDLTPASTPLTTTAITPSTPSSTLSTPTSTHSTPSFTSFTLLGTGVAVIIFAGYFYISRKPVPTKPAEQAPPPKKNAVFFHMQ